MFHVEHPPTPAARLCGCGCGEAVARRYRPGHDARHKGALQRAAAERTATGRMSRRAAAACQTACDLGWGRYIDATSLHISPVYRGNMERVHVDSCARFIRTPDGVGHSNHSCPAITRAARAAGQVNPTTRRAYYSFVERIDRTEWIPDGFDICEHCLRDWTLEEVAASYEMGRIEWDMAINPDEYTIPSLPNPIPWTILPDPSPFLPPTTPLDPSILKPPAPILAA